MCFLAALCCCSLVFQSFVNTRVPERNNGISALPILLVRSFDNTKFPYFCDISVCYSCLFIYFRIFMLISRMFCWMTTHMGLS